MSSNLLIKKKKIDDDLKKIQLEASFFINKSARKFLKKKGKLVINETPIIEAKKELDILKKNKKDKIINLSLKKCNFNKEEKIIKKDIFNVNEEYIKNTNKITPFINSFEINNLNTQKELIINSNKIINDYNTNIINIKEETALKLKKLNEKKEKKIILLKTEKDNIEKKLNILNEKRDKDLKKINDKIKTLKNKCDNTLKTEIEKSNNEIELRLKKGTKKKQSQVKKSKMIKKVISILNPFF